MFIGVQMLYISLKQQLTVPQYTAEELASICKIFSNTKFLDFSTYQSSETYCSGSERLAQSKENKSLRMAKSIRKSMEGVHHRNL